MARAGDEKKSSASPAVIAAIVAAGLAIAGQIVGKAVRDTLYLATFPVGLLPYFFLGTGVASGFSVAMYTRMNARFGPSRVVPALAVASAIALAALWVEARHGSAIVVGVLYVVITITGTFVVSGFWAVLGERFDARQARQMLGVVGGAATFGGLAGGLGTRAFLKLIDPESLVLVLAALDVLTAIAIVQMKRGDAVAARS